MTTENGNESNASALAMQIEIKKDGLSQLQDGSWVLKIKVHPNDMPTALMVAPMGTRYAAALVEIGDDEQPIERPKTNHARNAAMLCNDEMFVRFLTRRYGVYAVDDMPENAPATVRSICLVKSRSEFDGDPEAAKRWLKLKSEFEAWKLAP